MHIKGIKGAIICQPRGYIMSLRSHIIKFKLPVSICIAVICALTGLFILNKSLYTLNDNTQIQLASDQDAHSVDKISPDSQQISSLKESTETFIKGDTLYDILKRHNIPENQIHQISQVLKSKKIDSAHIKPGQEILLNYESNADETTLHRLSLPQGATATIHLMRNTQNNYDVMTEKKKISRLVELKIAEIEGSLFATAAKHGIPKDIVHALNDKFSHQIDFRRDIKSGDQFRVLYEEFHDDYGQKVKTGPIIYAAFDVRGKTIELFKYDFPDGHYDYYDRDGNNFKRSLLSKPIPNARISSNYGYRHHPVLKYRRLHKGMDYAAPPGTPIKAAGDGVIRELCRKGGYGRYIRIAHNSTYSTAYAHMSRYAPNLKAGSRVKQGQVIGYVGSDGLASGPHLHYEVLVNNVQVNPRSINLPTGEKLEKTHIASLQKKANSLYRNYADLNTFTLPERPRPKPTDLQTAELSTQ